MDEAIYLVSNILGCIKQLESSESLHKLRYHNLLSDLRSRLEVFQDSKDELDLNHAVELYRNTNIALEGEGAYNSTIWNSDVVVEGKTVILEDLMNDLEIVWRKLHQKESLQI